ncbi:GNAT family N-acetyltransferase [Mucilaginibacter ginkgonis]|uniref:GNAT family N-acetyltransferase n=1 Tax=Mucilaginibacter ginkgonis TaxID=2682091 RepID=A0A6I4HXI5_9SPHI|nr:GNAT family N-acetyltransferase [Mucilaginibacter ginkgonis]QQL49288.1 GNAT family N-acetyltransferase [Mucilaginibacter ginkgonis]
MYTITQATESDVQAIRALAEQTWWPTYTGIISPEQIRYMLDVIYNEETIGQQISNYEQTFLLLKEKDQPVAFAAYSVYDEQSTAYKLHKLYCLPITQGKGYGKALIDTVADIALKQGASKLYLNVNRHNNAQRFYQKMGFVIEKEIDIPFGEFVLNDYVMAKSLI